MRNISLASAAILAACSMPTAEAPAPIKVSKATAADPQPSADAWTRYASRPLAPPPGAVRMQDPAPAVMLKGEATGVTPSAAPEPPAAPPAPARLADLVEHMRRIVAQDPKNTRLQAQLAWLLALDEQYEAAETILRGLPAIESATPYHGAALTQKTIHWLVRHNLSDAGADAMLEELSGATLRRSGLKIDRALLCKEVKGYEDYVADDRARLDPGSWILIYVKVRNFDLDKSDGRFKMHLKYAWQLYDERAQDITPEGWKSADPSLREDKKLLSGEAHDFFQTFRLRFPQNMPRGRYKIKVTVSDAIRGAHAVGSDIPVEIAEIYAP